MIHSRQTKTAELNAALQDVKSKLSKHMDDLLSEGNQLACDAYKAYLIDMTKKKS